MLLLCFCVPFDIFGRLFALFLGYLSLGAIRPPTVDRHNMPNTPGTDSKKLDCSKAENSGGAVKGDVGPSRRGLSENGPHDLLHPILSWRNRALKLFQGVWHLVSSHVMSPTVLIPCSVFSSLFLFALPSFVLLPTNSKCFFFISKVCVLSSHLFWRQSAGLSVGNPIVFAEANRLVLIYFTSNILK